MILEKIILENFRTFYDRQEIIFSTDPEKNITLIHAGNGVGKTTLLNALLWCFYEEVTARFENRDDIICWQAKSEGVSEAKVEVYFQHDKSHYLVSRKINAKNNNSDFEAYKIESGDYKKISHPDLFVSTVVPKEMSKYFFFDGEYAETFSGHGNNKEVKMALERMLGCETAMQAVNDLKAIKKEIEEKIAGLAEDGQAKAFQAEVYKLNEKLEETKNKIEKLQNELELENRKKSTIDNQLKEAESAKAIHEKRSNLEKQMKELESSKNQQKTSLTKWVSEYSFSLFADKIVKRYDEIEEDGRVKGYIPSRISTGLIEEILKEMSCICGRSFERDSKETDVIQKLLQESDNGIMSERLMKINKYIGRLRQAQENVWNEFEEINSEIEKLNKKIDECEIGIKECSEQLRQSDIREIKEKEEARKSSEKRIAEIIKEIGALERDNQVYDKEKTELEKDIGKLLAKDERARGIQNQKLLLDKTIEILERELQKYREESRDTITKEINSILKETARRNYSCQIDENFNLEMFHGSNSTSVGKSSGENQLLSLAFIASLVSFALERKDEEHHLLKPGTMAPLMLDSPFGQLDPEYKKSTAEFLPELSHQIVLLVSKSQGDDDVIEVMKDRIGEEYVLILHNTAGNEGRPFDDIELKGEKIRCSLYDAEKDKTEIRRIS